MLHLPTYGLTYNTAWGNIRITYRTGIHSAYVLCHDHVMSHVINYTPTQRGNYHHGMFSNQSGTYDEISGSLGRWLSMTTAMGV